MNNGPNRVQGYLICGETAAENRCDLCYTVNPVPTLCVLLAFGRSLDLCTVPMRLSWARLSK